MSILSFRKWQSGGVKLGQAGCKIFAAKGGPSGGGRLRFGSMQSVGLRVSHALPPLNKVRRTMGCSLCRWPLTIAFCSETCDSLFSCEQILLFLVPKLVIWYAWCLHCGMLEDSQMILGRMRDQAKALWSPSFDFVSICGGFRLVWGGRCWATFHSCL